jgi:hypothetical protein
MLEPDPAEPLPSGIPGMRALASGLPRWHEAADWSWAARFGYQIVVKRGAAGSFFRQLEADFLREAEAHVPELADADLASRMEQSARGWCEVAALLKDQSELERCDPGLFEHAAERVAALADLEEAIFRDALASTAGLGASQAGLSPARPAGRSPGR